MFLNRLKRLRRSLAFRLTLWYAGIFIVSSCAVFVSVYLLMSSYLHRQIDQDLLKRVRTIRTVLNTEGVYAVERFAILEAQASGEKKIFIRLLSQNGSIFSSSNMSYWKNIGIKKDAIDRLFGGVPAVFDTISVSGHPQNVRLLYNRIGSGLVLQTGQSMEDDNRLIEVFQRIFFGIISVLFVVAALVGWFMARKALSKMALVTRTARSISDGSLDIRVPVSRRGDEVDQLADTFNRMLDRIEILISGTKEMSDNIAHDLKSPITRIRGIAEVNLTTGASMEAFEGMSASIIEDCDRLLEMINTMLVISKTEAGVDRLDLKNLDLAELIRQAVICSSRVPKTGGSVSRVMFPITCSSKETTG